MRFVIIGGVAAGMSAASKLRRLDPGAEIVVYERGRHLSYGACGLPYYVGGWIDDPDLMIARTREQFQAMRVETRLRCSAVSVEPEARRVALLDHETGHRFTDSYDALMLAVGAESVVPDVPGAQLPGVYYLKTMDDGLRLREAARDSRVQSAVVVGGGAIGVEMADALLRLGKSVTLLQSGDSLLPTYEPEFSELAAQALEKRGARVLVRRRVSAVEQTGDGLTVCANGERWPCELAVMAVGVRPATGFLRGTGLRTAVNGALLVSREMRTSIPSIYAAGDCAMVYDRVADRDRYWPLGTVANKCGRIAGANMAGGHERFAGMLGTAAIQVGGLEMARTGLSETEAGRLGYDVRSKMVVAADHAAYYPDPVRLYLKLVYEHPSKRLLGACVAGERNAVLRIDALAVAIHAGMRTDELGMVDLAYAPPFAGAWDAIHIAANAAK